MLGIPLFCSFLLTLFIAEAQVPSHRIQFLNFSKMGPSHGLQFLKNCSSIGPFHMVLSFRNILLCLTDHKPFSHGCCTLFFTFSQVCCNRDTTSIWPVAGLFCIWLELSGMGADPGPLLRITAAASPYQNLSM